MLDVIVIGAGPAGLSAAVNLRQRGKTLRVYYSGAGKLALAPRVDNYLGFSGIDGVRITDEFRAHAEKLGIEMVKAKVLNVVSMGDHFMLNAAQNIVEARRVILAVGSQSSQLLPGEEKLLGRGVSYCSTCDGMMYRGKRVAVLGLTREAVEEANFLHRIGVSVLFLYRTLDLSGLAEEIERRKIQKVTLEGDSELTGLTADGEAVEMDGLFILRESVAPAAMVAGLVMEKGQVKVNQNLETNIPGLYAAGDCTGPPYQAMKAAGEGQLAALKAAEA